LSHANDNIDRFIDIQIDEASICYKLGPVETSKRSGHQRRADPAPVEGAEATLVTGDCLERLKEMATGSVCVMFFSPPYNKHVAGMKSNWRKTGTWKTATLGEGYASYSDDMPHDAYVAWMHAVLLECWRVVKDDGAIFFQHKDQHRKGVLVTPDELNPGLPLRQRIIWNRGSGMNFNASHLLPTFEYVYVFAKPKFKFGQCGTTHAVINAAPDYGNDHPAPFPVDLPRAIFKALRPTDKVICDPFSGSGSTGVAALAEGRNYIGIELDAGYNTKAAERLGCADPNIVPLTARLWLGDCLEAMRRLPDESVDLIACDLPYAVTKEFWDKIVPMDELWAEYRRVLKPTGNIVLTSAGMFTAKLMMAAPDLYKYSNIWLKTRGTNFFHKDYRPLAKHEDVLVFMKGGMGVHAKTHATYNPQGLVKLDKPFVSRNGNKPSNSMFKARGLKAEQGRYQTHTNWPTTILKFGSATLVEGDAPQTQKPVALMDWIVRTYSNPGDVVLDNTMGSGTTGVAALAAGRSFIGIELNPAFYETASSRIREAAPEGVVFSTDVPPADARPVFFKEATARIVEAAPDLASANDQERFWDDAEQARWDAARAAYREATGVAA